jgi:hypothetical protein
LSSKNAGDPEGLKKYLETRATSSQKSIIGDKSGVSKLGSRYKVSSEDVREILRKAGWELEARPDRGGRFWRPKDVSTMMTDIL